MITSRVRLTMVFFFELVPARGETERQTRILALSFASKNFENLYNVCVEDQLLRSGRGHSGDSRRCPGVEGNREINERWLW